MPKRTDIQSILIIGAGPIVIGQACEFDYSGTQACKALREEGYRVVLVNSNPATIMTDPEMADRTYIEPVTPKYVEKIIAIERPDAVLPTLGGQTALKLGKKFVEEGIKIFGTDFEMINFAEDRGSFSEFLKKLDIPFPSYGTARDVEGAVEIANDIGYPVIIKATAGGGGRGSVQRV